MSFTIENKNQKKMSFLDVQIIYEDTKVTISIFRKPTFNGFYTYFERFLSSSYRFGAIYKLTYRCQGRIQRFLKGGGGRSMSTTVVGQQRKY